MFFMCNLMRFSCPWCIRLPLAMAEQSQGKLEAFLPLLNRDYKHIIFVFLIQTSLFYHCCMYLNISVQHNICTVLHIRFLPL